MERKGFLLYHSYLKTLGPLNDAEFGRLLRACLTYSMTGEAPELRGNERLLFATIQEQIDRDAAGYKEKCEKQRQNAMKRWGCQSMPTDANACQSMPTDAKDANIKAKANANAKAKANETSLRVNPPFIISPQTEPAKKSTRFTPPTVEEVRAYCRERGNKVNPDTFVDFYISNGWKVGKNPMKDWKAAVRTWERNESNKSSQPSQQKPKIFRASDYLGDKAGEYL